MTATARRFLAEVPLQMAAFTVHLRMRLAQFHSRHTMIERPDLPSGVTAGAGARKAFVAARVPVAASAGQGRMKAGKIKSSRAKVIEPSPGLVTVTEAAIVVDRVARRTPVVPACYVLDRSHRPGWLMALGTAFIRMTRRAGQSETASVVIVEERHDLPLIIRRFDDKPTWFRRMDRSAGSPRFRDNRRRPRLWRVATLTVCTNAALLVALHAFSVIGPLQARLGQICTLRCKLSRVTLAARKHCAGSIVVMAQHTISGHFRHFRVRAVCEGDRLELSFRSLKPVQHNLVRSCRG